MTDEQTETPEYNYTVWQCPETKAWSVKLPAPWHTEAGGFLSEPLARTWAEQALSLADRTRAVDRLREREGA